MWLVDAMLAVVRAALFSRARLAVENLALRQQLAVETLGKASATTPTRSNLLGMALSDLAHVALRDHHRVKPETVIRWHARAFVCTGAGSLDRKEDDHDSTARSAR